MRLDGLEFLLAVWLLFSWGMVLAMALALGFGKQKARVIAATVVTGVLASLLIATFGDGSATMQQRPLGMWGMFVVLLLAAVPVMLAAPFLQLAQHVRGTASRAPVAMLAWALVLVPVASFVHALLQEHLASRTLEQARALAPNRILPHVVTAPQQAADSWLSPYLWSEQAELKWITIGVSRLGFIENPEPISADDTQALELLVSLSSGTEGAHYTWMLEAKLVWDRLLRAAPGDRLAIAAGLTQQQAQQFMWSIGMPHTDWLCTPLEDPATVKAFGHIWTLLLPDQDRERFSNRVKEVCGRSIGVPVRTRGQV